MSFEKAFIIWMTMLEANAGNEIPSWIKNKYLMRTIITLKQIK